MKYLTFSLLISFLMIATLYAQNEVTFQIDMSIKMLEGVFKPDEGDILIIRGCFNDWTENTHVLTDDNSDSVYTGTYTISCETDSIIEYKYVIHQYNEFDLWESNPNPSSSSNGNRILFLTNSPIILPIVYFDNDRLPTTIIFKMNTKVIQNIGVFNPTRGDSIQIRGSFNNWFEYNRRNSVLIRDLLDTNIYFTEISINAEYGDTIPYKFYIGCDDFSYCGMNYFWEEPLSTGNGNRDIIFEEELHQEAPIKYFNDIPHEGIILNGDTIVCTFCIDMNPALNASIPFNPVTDSVFLYIQDAIWAWTQGYTPYSIFSGTCYNDPDQDLIYTITVNIAGPSYYGIIYKIAYGTNCEQIKLMENNDDVVVFGRNRVRFIQPLGPNQFPSVYSFPIDTWTEDPPLFIEPQPLIPVSAFNPHSSCPSNDNYYLMNNYPNPFNCTTIIEYSLPKTSIVKILIFNLNGSLVEQLVNRKLTPGYYAVTWDASKHNSGVYFYQIKADGFHQVKKMLLIK